MKSIKKLLLLLLAVAATGAFAAKPVGVWEGLAWQRIGELVNATVFSPQWHKDKPLTVKFTGKEFDKVSAVVYMHGFNQVFRFREWKQDTINKMENFVSTKTVVGEPIKVGEITLLPIIEVAVGVGAGARLGGRCTDGWCKHHNHSARQGHRRIEGGGA